MFNFTKTLALALSLYITTALANDVPQISQQALLAALNVPNNNIVLLDVRTAEEFNEGHVAGAINISHSDIEGNLDLLAQYKASTVVVYCRSGRRAGVAEDILAEHGFTKLKHLTGDMIAWNEANLPVVSTTDKQ